MRVRHGQIAAHLGAVLGGRGKPEQARHVWEEALKFAADNKVLQQTIKLFIP